ncbi:MAG: hypothetical protein ACJ76M_13195, partial [Solirubrobacteraceae bacterium]
MPARVRRDVQSLLAEGDSGRKVLEDYAWHRGDVQARQRPRRPEGSPELALPGGDARLATKFPYFDIDGTKKELAIGDIVVSENLGYVYESTDPPGHPAVMAAIAARTPVAMGDTRLVGAASDVPFATRAEVDIDLEGKREGL